jgi:hypothetical protein
MPLNREFLEAALIGYAAQIAKIEQAMAEIRSQLKGSGGVSKVAAPSGKRRKFSAAVRKKMAAAQKARWAAIRAKKSAK